MGSGGGGGFWMYLRSTPIRIYNSMWKRSRGRGLAGDGGRNRGVATGVGRGVTGASTPLPLILPAHRSMQLKLYERAV